MQAGFALGYRDDVPLRCELPAFEIDGWRDN
jgi:hypothetical protein